MFTKNLSLFFALIMICIALIGSWSCKKDKEKDNTPVLLFLLLGSQSTSTTSSGFLISIPDGVAK